MKRLFYLLFLMMPAMTGLAQQLSQVTFTTAGKLSWFSFLTDQGVLIRVSEDGRLLEWGTEVLSDRGNYFSPKLQPFLGRVEYYGNESDTLFKGKLKSIGTCFFTYYGAFETSDKTGKPKTIGRLYIDYYSEYDEKSMRGKIKSVGGQQIEYYGAFENEAFRGKLKSIDQVPITYYSVFDDKLNAGKLKSIGSVPYVWYSTFDRTELRGALKTRNRRQVIGSITYILI